MTLTKIDITQSINSKYGYPKKHCSHLVDVLLETIKKRLESGEDVLISRFGKFCLKDMGEHRGRSSVMGSDINPGAKRIVHFKCSDVLKHKLNGKSSHSGSPGNNK